MRLDELLGVKSLHKYDVQELVDVIDKMTPYKHKGGGAFANVFERDGKIYKFWLKDGAYEKFLDFVKENKSPALPKILSPVKSLTTFFKRTEITPTKIKYVIIEKLDPFEPFDKVETLDKTGRTIDTVLRCMALSIGADSEYSFEEEFRSRAKLDLFEKFTPEFAEFMKIGYKIYKTFGRKMLDLKFDNVMKRGKQIVYTDPVYSTADFEFNDLIDQLADNHVDMVKGRPKGKEGHAERA